MKIAILINARLGSKRLPKKHLRDIGGKLAIEQLFDRLAEFKDSLILATGDERENKDLYPVAQGRNIPVVFGDQDNIPNRHLQIARKYRLDAIVSIDADDLLTSPKAVAAAVAALKEGKPLVRTEGLPLGMNVLWAYTLETLIASIQSATGEGSYDTGWGWIFTTPIHRIAFSVPEAGSIRATLDYPEDLRFFRVVFERCPVIADDLALCRWVVANNFHTINKKYACA